MKEENKRISWEQYFMNLAFAASERSTCFSDKKGAVIVKDKMIISTGYSGAPKGIKNCLYDNGFCRKRALGFGHGEGHSQCLAVHAEANAILQCNLLSTISKNCQLYCTHKPCENCAKLIINAGIKEVYYTYDYPSELTDYLFKEAEIKVIKI